MKILQMSMILLLIILPSLSLAASHRCAENYNDGVSLLNEGNGLFDEGNESLKAFYDLYTETTKTFHLNRLFNRPQQENSTDEIITAIKLHDSGLKITKKAKTKLERSIQYFKRAKKYCDDDDYDAAKRLYENANSAVSDVNESLFGSDRDFALEYAGAKFELLASLIRITMTDTAIYVIENENIDLNHSPEVNRPLLIIAAENGATDIARALIINGADINIQNKNGYSAIEIAAISGDDQLFSSLFKLKASTFQLSGFNNIPKYKTCNLADMVHLSSYSDELRDFVSGANKNSGHTIILEFLKAKGLTAVCNLNPLLARVNNDMISQNDIDFVFALKVAPEYYKQNPEQEMPASQKIKYEKDILNYLVNQHLQAQIALNLGIEADQEVVDKYATGIHNQTNNIKF
ncbi:MAG: ankyrin repeat domain-containing protein, partial [Desulfuromonadales bacterium]|nr:ankyrin repeat domain-containing protein [Desulfuromonadales bacterium]